MKIEKYWETLDDQVIDEYNRGAWNVQDLIEKSAHLPVVDVPLDFLNLSLERIECVDIVEFCRHMKHVQDANLKYPIIMSSKGQLLDGRHRIAKALLKGHETIKCRRLTPDIEPTYELTGKDGEM